MKIINLNSPLFQLLADFGIDFSKFDTATATVGDYFLISLFVLVVLVFLLLVIRGLFYALREIFGGCLH